MKEPFDLPSGNVQIAFSGGRSSAMMVGELAARNDLAADRVVVAFQNTGREMPETLDFIAECATRWAVPVVWLEYAVRRHVTSKELDLVARIFGPAYAARLESWWVPTDSGFRVVNHNSAARHGEPLLALILQKKYLPNQRTRFCTIEAKVRTAKRYLVAQGWSRWTNLCGMRADEPTRLKAEQPKERYSNAFPLADAGIAKPDVTAFWAAQPFDLRLPNVGGKCWLGNCDGCFLKSEANLTALARDFPERHAWWERMEELASELTINPNGATWSKRYRRAELRDLIERVPDMLDKGFLCQADDGECFA